MPKPKIKSFEDACKALKITPELPNVTALPELHQKAIVALYKLVIIAQALNAGWTPDWDNHNEWKYYPWFRMSGSGLSFLDCVIDRSYSGVGSRLCFKTSELAEYAGEQFQDLYTDYFLINK